MTTQKPNEENNSENSVAIERVSNDTVHPQGSAIFVGRDAVAKLKIQNG